MSRRALLAPLVLLAAMLATSCTGGSSYAPPRPYKQRVGPEGGTIEDPGGAVLVIPAGALDEKTAITVTTFQDTVDLGTEYTALAGALCGVKLEPDGLEFAEPVTLRITPAHALEPGTYPVFFYDAEAEKWVQTGEGETSEDGAYVETEITHFSSCSVFDMPYDVLDDFPADAADRADLFPEDSPADYGMYYVSNIVFENESFCGPDQYYNGCCYMRSKGKVHLEYSWDGAEYIYDGTYDGYETDTSYVLSYSYSGERLEYTIDLTVYLDCSSADGVFVAGADERALKKGESTEVYAILKCGNEPIPDRVVTFTVSGVGSLSSGTALTDEEGNASVSYSATEEGTAEVKASLDGCTCKDPGVAEDSVTITVSDSEEVLDDTWHGVLAIDLTMVNGVDEDTGLPAGIPIRELEDHCVIEFTFEVSGLYVYTCAGTFTETHDLDVTYFAGETYEVDEDYNDDVLMWYFTYTYNGSGSLEVQDYSGAIEEAAVGFPYPEPTYTLPVFMAHGPYYSSEEAVSYNIVLDETGEFIDVWGSGYSNDDLGLAGVCYDSSSGGVWGVWPDPPSPYDGYVRYPECDQITCFFQIINAVRGTYATIDDVTGDTLPSSGVEPAAGTQSGDGTYAYGCTDYTYSYTLTLEKVE